MLAVMYERQICCSRAVSQRVRACSVMALLAALPG